MNSSCVFNSQFEQVSLQVARETFRGNQAMIRELQSVQQTTLDRITELKNAMIDESRLQRIGWALANSHLGSFKFWQNGHGFHIESKDFAIEVLLHFRRGTGCRVDERTLDNCGFDTRMKEGREEEFREALSVHIHTLTGVKPRFEKDSEGY